MSFRSAGVGPRRTIALPADPALGAELVLGANNFWRVLAVRFTFTASAVVAGRVVRVCFDDNNGNEFVRIIPGQTVNASTVGQFSFAVGMQIPAPPVDPLAWGAFNGPIPDDLILYPGWRFYTSTLGIDVGDQFTNLRLLAEYVLPTPEFFPWV